MDSEERGALLRGLDPESRALLELSVRRGVTDHEIATLLGTQPQEVEERIRALLVQVGDQLGVGPDEARRRLEGDAPAERGCTQGAEAVEEDEPEADAEPDRAAQREPLLAPAGRPDRGARRAILTGCLLVLSVGIVIGVLLALGEDESGEDRSSTKAGQATRETGGAERRAGAGGERRRAAPRRRAARLYRLGRSGRGGVRFGRGRLRIKLSELPDPMGSFYEVWLYDSVARAVPVGRFDGSSVDLDARLRADPADYRFVDVSLEPRDGNPNHSGSSVMRARIPAPRSHAVP